MTKAANFLQLHHDDSAFIIPNPWDVGSARILAGFGFKALATTSAGMSFSWGVRDGDAKLEQVLDHCRMIVDATPLPVSADLENGFGHEPEIVAETIKAAAETGLAGGSIEDHTGDKANPIYDFDLAVERIAAAVKAARNVAGGFVLTARCENFLHNRPDLDDTIRRLQAFEKAGADVLYAPGLRDLDSICTVCAALGKPVNVVMGLPGTTFGVKDLSAAGVKRISVGSALARLAYGSLLKAATEMTQKETFSFAGGAAGFSEIEDFFK